MASLIFILTFLTLLVFAIIVLIKLARRKPVRPVLKKMGAIVLTYLLIWIFFKSKSTNIAVPFGTDVCFDDWCATVTQTEKTQEVQKQFASLSADSTWVIVHIRMSNHARGIAQKPSEPRVHIVDSQGNSWPWSARGQQLFESTSGAQPGIGHRLELHQSLETALVFAVPKNATGLQALIEEGPFITNFIFAADNSVIEVK